jgi:hypothetical protein
MPIPNLTDETPINQYVASSAQTEFAFTFYIFAESDIKVYVNDILKTITTDYAVRKNDGGVIGSADLPMDGGKIVFNVGLTAGAKVSINREVPIDRSTQFSTGGSFKADVLNSELTRILTVAQQLKRDVSRSFRLAPSDAEGGSLQLPTDRANNILAFDGSSNLTLIKLADIDKANVSPFIATLLNDADAAEARTTLNAQPLAANLTNFSNLTPAANKALIINGSGAMAFQDRLATTTNQGVVYLNNPITIANNATDANNDIDFSAGNFNLRDGSGQAIYAGGTGQLDVLFGTANGMLATGTKAINSTYHLYMVSNPTTGVSKPLAILGTSGTAPDPTSLLPSGYTKFKRAGSILTDGSGNIRAFTQFGNYFKYATGISDLNGSFVAGSTTPQVSTPLGINALGIFNIGLDISSVSTGNNIWSVISDFNQTSNLGIVSHRQSSVTVTKIPSFINIASGSAFAFTNLSSQIRISNNEGVPATTLAGMSLLTHGFIDINLNS